MEALKVENDLAKHQRALVGRRVEKRGFKTMVVEILGLGGNESGFRFREKEKVKEVGGDQRIEGSNGRSIRDPSAITVKDLDHGMGF